MSHSNKFNFKMFHDEWPLHRFAALKSIEPLLVTLQNSTQANHPRSRTEWKTLHKFSIFHTTPSSLSGLFVTWSLRQSSQQWAVSDDDPCFQSPAEESNSLFNFQTLTRVKYVAWKFSPLQTADDCCCFSPVAGQFLGFRFLDEEKLILLPEKKQRNKLQRACSDIRTLEGRKEKKRVKQDKYGRA